MLNCQEQTGLSRQSRPWLSFRSLSLALSLSHIYSMFLLQCWRISCSSQSASHQTTPRKSWMSCMRSSYLSRINGELMWVPALPNNRVYEADCSPKVCVCNSLQNVMILGDFCADGLYVTHKQMKELRIRSDNNFHWLIGDDVDTTSDTSKDHTYDRHVRVRSAHAPPFQQDLAHSQFLPACHRIVVYGDDMLAAVVPNSAKPFDFHKEFCMTEEMVRCPTQPVG